MANVTGIGTNLGLNNFAKEGRLRSITGTNALQNPLLDADNGYPIGFVYNGQLSGNSDTSFYPQHWSPNSGVYIDAPSSYRSVAPCFHNTNYRPYDDTAKFGGTPSGDPESHLDGINYSGGRIRKMYGQGTAFTSFTANPDRTYPNYPVTHCTTATKTVNGTTTWEDDECWSKYEWTQGVSIPDGLNTCTFGAYIRCPSNDLFRELNFGGVYVWQDIASTPPSNVYINSIAVKRAATTLNLRTGSCPSGQGAFNWSGNSEDLTGFPSRYGGRWNDTCFIQSITYKDAEDYPDFIAVEKTFTLQSGTGRRLGFGTYFMENQSYMPITPPSPNPLSGSIEFYNPFVIFSS